MQIKVTTWNINSVRLRIGLVGRFIKAVQPDILCLQETKCPDDRFPRKQFKRLGYEHFALNGQKGYHGVVVVSRLPFESTAIKAYCGKSDCRHVAVALGERAGLKDPITLHNFYVPAGGDVPDPSVNVKFAHKLAFLDEMHACETLRPTPSGRAIIVGDLNVAPLECDVWSHKQLLSVVSHTPIECEKLLGLQKAGGWVDAVRALRAGADQALHLVELSFARLDQIRPGSSARPHLDIFHVGRSGLEGRGRQGISQRQATLRPRPGDRDAGTIRSCSSYKNIALAP